VKKARSRAGAIRTFLLAFLAVAVIAGRSSSGASKQTPAAGNSKSGDTASCMYSQNQTKDDVSIRCQGMNPEQAARVSAAFNILPVMNKLLEDKLDPDVVTAKLNELTKSASSSPRAKTYFCDGMWKSGAPDAKGVLDTKTGGNDSEFLSMINLLEKQKYSELLTKCTANIKSTPDWLTPRLFCGLAYAGLGRNTQAEPMLKEFQQKAGPDYDVPDCHNMLVILRHNLGKEL
jgi:hypothetical protein